ncbi:recombinase family protein [Micromonospora psammae]|uniref:recombinase family protein n=1 Tax=Micromonospora sp. CPCC 205556 TaxID=3122398 RepID=UPI002FF0FED9
MRLLGAVRLSRHRGEGDPSTSPDRQDASILAEAKARNGEIVGWARDLDVSAIKLSPFQRPALGEWLSSAKVSQYDGIVWSRLDRAVRSMADLHTLAQWATTNRKVLIFASGPGGSSMSLDMRSGPMDAIPHLIVTILAFAAQMEAQAITERNKDTRAYMRQIGRWSGGMHPYHTKPVQQGNGWQLVENPETAPVMREIIERVLKGESKLSIARDLNSRGIASPREYRVIAMEKEPRAPKAGRVSLDEKSLTIAPDDCGEPVVCKRFPVHADWAVTDGQHVDQDDRLTLPILWNSKTIKEQLTARALLGEVEFQGKAVLDKDGKPVKRCEPLVNRDDWTKLQRVLDDASKPTAKPRTTNAALLLGTVFCAFCGERMYSRNQGKSYGPGRYAYYGCRSSWGYVMTQTKDTKCRAKSVYMDALEAAVERLLMDNVGDLVVLREVVRAGESHRDELESAKAALIDLLERTAGKPEAVQMIYKAQIEAVEARVAHLASLPETEERVELESTGQTYRQVWASAGETERRRLLKESGVRVEVAKAESGELAPALLPSDVDDYPAVSVAVIDGIQLSMLLPRTLAERVSGNPSAKLTFRQRSLIPGMPDRVL